MIVLPCSPGEDLEEGEVALELFGCVWGPEGLDGGCLQQLGEDVRVRVRGCVCDQIRNEPGRCGAIGICQVYERLQGLYGPAVYLIHLEIVIWDG